MIPHNMDKPALKKKDIQSQLGCKVFRDLQVRECSEDVQRDLESFYIHEKESSIELRNLKF